MPNRSIRDGRQGPQIIAPVRAIAPMQPRPTIQPVAPIAPRQTVAPVRPLGPRDTIQPTPTLSVDPNGNRSGARPVVGPASAQEVHARMQAMEAQAQAPRPQAVRTGATGIAPIAPGPTTDLSAARAGVNIAARPGVIDNAVDEASR